MSLVTYEVDNHIATITLNRPEARNAINGALRDDLNAARRKAAAIVSDAARQLGVDLKAAPAPAMQENFVQKGAIISYKMAT